MPLVCDLRAGSVWQCVTSIFLKAMDWLKESKKKKKIIVSTGLWIGSECIAMGEAKTENKCRMQDVLW